MVAMLYGIGIDRRQYIFDLDSPHEVDRFGYCRCLYCCFPTCPRLAFQAFLPEPLPSIAFNNEATKIVFDDTPFMVREFKLRKLDLRCAKRFEKMKPPIYQVIVHHSFQPVCSSLRHP